MLLDFVYLAKPKLAGYAAQVDGGLIAETKTRSMKTGSASAGLGGAYPSRPTVQPGKQEVIR